MHLCVSLYSVSVYLLCLLQTLDIISWHRLINKKKNSTIEIRIEINELCNFPHFNLNVLHFLYQYHN